MIVDNFSIEAYTEDDGVITDISIDFLIGTKINTLNLYDVISETPNIKNFLKRLYLENYECNWSVKHVSYAEQYEITLETIKEKISFMCNRIKFEEGDVPID